MPESPIFKTVGLTKVYGEGASAVHALRGVDLEVPEGELIVLLGPSGSGKSTLLNIMGGLDRPSSGEMYFRGTDITRMSESDLTEYRRNHVGFIIQFYNLIPSLTAHENVALVAEIAKDPMPTDEALELVGLHKRTGHFPAQLSGGEQQRVAIARAIAKRPTVMLCDEPTGALDSKTGVIVLEALETVNRETGTTTMIITHNAGIADMADRVLYFADGQLSDERRNAERRPPREISW